MSSPPTLSDLSLSDRNPDRHPLKGLHEARGIRRVSLHSRSVSIADDEPEQTPPPAPELSEVPAETLARIQAFHMSRMGRDRSHSSPPEPEEPRPIQRPHPHVTTEFGPQLTSPEVSPFTSSSVPRNNDGFQQFQTGSLPKQYTGGVIPPGINGPLTGPLTGPMGAKPVSRQSSLSSRRGMRLPGSPLVSDDEGSNATPKPMNMHLPDYSKLSYNGESSDSRSRESSASSTSSTATTPSCALTGGLTGPTSGGARLPGRLSSQNSIKRKGPGKLSLSGSPGGSPVTPSDGSSAPLPIATDHAPPQAPAQGGGLFAQFSKIVDINTGKLNFAGKASLHSEGIDFSGGTSFRINIDELEPLGELGRGNYGTVTKVLHKPTGITMAMKEVKLELDTAKFAQIIMELDILHKCESPYIVDFFGAFFVEGAVYECIEYMDGGSLDKVYAGGVDEPYLAAITDSVVRGLMFLKEEHNIIHRDVKPTNILINTEGKVKLCDFGVSGNLVASKASTVIGCQSYMAPERIHNPDSGNVTYTANSDIWSLGVSILEIAQGSYPYPPEAYNNVFAQLRAIVSGDPPQLAERFSPEARDFVAQCLQKKPYQRPTYQQLLEHPWLKKYRGVDVGMADFVKKALERRKNAATSTSHETTPTATVVPVARNNLGSIPVARDGRSNQVPALHHTFLNNRQ